MLEKYGVFILKNKILCILDVSRIYLEKAELEDCSPSCTSIMIHFYKCNEFTWLGRGVHMEETQGRDCDSCIPILEKEKMSLKARIAKPHIFPHYTAE